MYQTIATEIDHAVGIISLNRPDRQNAVDELLIAELSTALTDFENNEAIRVVVLSSIGELFCAGADTEWLQRGVSYTEEENLRDARYLANMMATLDEFPKPTIARVQGPAHGQGIGLIAACDVAIGTYDAEFSFSAVRMGIVPSVISPYVLAAIGSRYSRRYMLTAERFSAAEAYRIGLLHEIVPGETQLDEAISELIENLLVNGPKAQTESKLMIRAIAGLPIDESVIEQCAQHSMYVRSGDECKEGLAALTEGRKPAWAVAAEHPTPTKEAEVTEEKTESENQIETVES